MTDERLMMLREKMAETNTAVYIVPTADFHESEYVGEYFKARAFLTGFSGSAGTAVVTQDSAVLFTDGRYFIQAERELEGSGFTLMRMGEKDVPTLTEYVRSVLPPEGVIGFDGRTMNAAEGEKLLAIAEEKGGSLSVSEAGPSAARKKPRTCAFRRICRRDRAGEDRAYPRENEGIRGGNPHPDDFG